MVGNRRSANSCHLRYLLSYFCDRLSICKNALENSICYLKSSTVMWTAVFLRGKKKKSRDGQCARTFRCLHRQANEKGKKEDCPLPSLLSHWWSCRWADISVAWPQLYWGQLSARLCWNYGLASCPQHTDLAVTLNTASPRGGQILSPHSPNFAQETKPTHPTHSRSSPAASFP